MDAKMVKEFVRMDCVSNGHNSGTCNNGESSCNSRTCNNGKRVMLFGVDINSIPTKDAGTSIKRSISMEVLETPDKNAHANDDPGYHSDGIIHRKRAKADNQWRRGTPWSVEEHRSFLAGLKQLGKGDWKGIARNYVITRTSTQVASHAQKYFKRKADPSNKKRPSLFDIPLEPEGHQAGLQLPSLPYNGATSSQASNMVQFTNNFSAPRFPNSAVSGGHHNMVGNPDRQSCRELRIAQPAFVPMANYIAPATTHPSGIPAPHTFPLTDPTASPITKNYPQLQIQ